MSNLSPVRIDFIQQNTQDTSTDVLSIEWFELNKRKISRPTDSGVFVELVLAPRTTWQHNDLLFAKGQCIARINIKPCLVIQCLSKELKDVADFCYFVSNRHLPIYYDTDSQICTVPYDGKLYEQLTSRLGSKINLTEARLVESNEIKKQFKQHVAP